MRKNTVILIGFFLLSALLNLLGRKGLHLDRVEKPKYFFLTVGFWLMLIVQALWISFLQSRRKQDIPYYLLGVFLPAVLYLFIIGTICMFSPHKELLFFSYLCQYMPYVLLLLTGYAVLSGYTPQSVLYIPWSAQRPDTSAMAGRADIANPPMAPPGLDAHIPLNDLFYKLYRHNGGFGSGHNFEKGTLFFNLVAVESHSKRHYAIFTDGTRLRWDNLLEQLDNRSLSNWMVRISREYRVNMLLVQHPIVKPATDLSLQPEVLMEMQQKMQKGKILMMLHAGSGLRGKHVKDFLERKNTLDYGGWNRFIAKV